jgi:Mn-containing catalase
MVNHPAARALTGYLLVRGGVHQIAHARALELLTGAHLTKMFPTPRIPTEKIPESKEHIDKGLHKILYRFSPSDYQELSAVFTGPHPETGEELEVEQGPPEGALPRDLPPQPAVFAPDYAPYRSPRSLNACARTPGSPKSPRPRSRTAAKASSTRPRTSSASSPPTRSGSAAASPRPAGGNGETRT